MCPCLRSHPVSSWPQQPHCCGQRQGPVEAVLSHWASLSQHIPLSKPPPPSPLRCRLWRKQRGERTETWGKSQEKHLHSGGELGVQATTHLPVLWTQEVSFIKRLWF